MRPPIGHIINSKFIKENPDWFDPAEVYLAKVKLEVRLKLA
tara:strand:+ start:672 stop:794 length:123 start_codon:yes stop_codon:yes gene_type:complete